MTSQEVFSKLAKLFKVKEKTSHGYVDDGSKIFNTIEREINCDYARKNINILTCDKIKFFLRTFIMRPFDFINSLPEGYNQEEFTVATPLPLANNNSHDRDFINKAYNVVQPYIQRKYSIYPVFLENRSGIVYLCLMLEPEGICFNNKIEVSRLETAINVLSKIKEDVKRTYR